MRTGGEQHDGVGQAHVPDARGGGGRRPDEHGGARTPRGQGRAGQSPAARRRTLRAAAARSRPARSGGARPAGGVQLRDVQPHGLDDVRRQPDPARAGRHGLVRRRAAPWAWARTRTWTRGSVRPARAQQRGPKPGGGGGRPDRGPLQGLRPHDVRRDDDARLRRAAAPAGRGLHQPQRHGRELRRWDLLPPSLLVDRRGDRRRPRRGRSRSPASPSAHGYLFQTPVDRGRNKLERRRADHGRGPLLARGGGGRPAHRHRL